MGFDVIQGLKPDSAELRQILRKRRQFGDTKGLEAAVVACPGLEGGTEIGGFEAADGFALGTNGIHEPVEIDQAGVLTGVAANLDAESLAGVGKNAERRRGPSGGQAVEHWFIIDPVLKADPI